MQQLALLVLIWPREAFHYEDTPLHLCVMQEYRKSTSVLMLIQLLLFLKLLICELPVSLFSYILFGFSLDKTVTELVSVFREARSVVFMVVYRHGSITLVLVRNLTFGGKMLMPCC
jgi:hypothetical protein